MKDLELANSRLQNRIIELNEQITKLKSEQGNLLVLNKKLKEDNDRLKSKLEHKEDLIKKYQIDVKYPAKSNVKEYKSGKQMAKTKANNKKKRSKMIYGILKNKYRYNLSSADITFLKNIQSLHALSEKQREWYGDICNRNNLLK